MSENNKSGYAIRNELLGMAIGILESRQSRHFDNEYLKPEGQRNPINPFTTEDVLVEVKATALNRADLLQRRGRYPAPLGIRGDVPGLEMAGVVLSVGDLVEGFSEGDRVFGLLGGGGYAEKVITNYSMLAHIPDNLDFNNAAAVPEAFMTAYDALFNHCELRMGESALIHAAGSGVGTAAILLA